MIAGKFTCPDCGSHFELNTTKAPVQQAARVANVSGAGNIASLLDEIQDAVMLGWVMDDRAETFYRETRERWEKYGDRIKFSDKQMVFLKSIAAKAGVD